jgi:tetrapyrrole methylase family protein/MazG family protein
MGAPGRVVVVGLGPGSVDLLLPAARATLERIPVRYARTARHPTVAPLVADGITFETFDDRYDAAPDLDAVYHDIVTALIGAAAEHGELAYAVPGSPSVAERTVALLHDAARDGRVELTTVPGLSFAELAWTRLGVDPMTDPARVVDARALESAALDLGGLLLVAQCDDPLLCSDVKLTLLERLSPDTPVTVLARLGGPDERVDTVALADLDRVVPDHLTSLAVQLPDSSPGRELTRLLELARLLRRPGGCPWDAEQTHHSVTRYLLEEAYEVVDAVEALPVPAPAGTPAHDPAYTRLVDELGDLLYQVIFHAMLAEEAGAFGMGDVARGIHDKLVHRHPHVFGDVAAATSGDVMRNWEQIKKGERGATSIMDGITPGLPSLLYAHKLLRKAASVGLDPGGVAASLDRIDVATAALRAGADDELVLGELLAGAVALARALGFDAESALRGWSVRFRTRFEAMEADAAREGVDLAALDPGAAAARWDAAGPTVRS